VDDDVTLGEDGSVALGEAEAVGSHVAGDDGEAPVDHVVEGFGPAELDAKPVEGVVADDLALDPLGRRRAAPAPHEHDDLAVRHRPEQPLDDGRAQEAGGAGDGDALAGQCLGDHGQLLTIW
jgi:hypothetical protein